MAEEKDEEKKSLEGYKKKEERKKRPNRGTGTSYKKRDLKTKKAVQK